MASGKHNRVVTALKEGTARGFLEPVARRVSKWLKDHTPVDSWFENDALGAGVLSGFGQFVESLGSGSPTWRVATDFLADIMKSLGGPERPSAERAQTVGGSLLRSFEQHAIDKLKAAKPGEFDVLKTQLLAELEFRKEMLRHLREAIAALDEAEARPTPAVTAPRNIAGGFDRMCRQVAQSIQRQVPAARARPSRVTSANTDSRVPIFGGEFDDQGQLVAQSGVVELGSTALRLSNKKWRNAVWALGGSLITILGLLGLSLTLGWAAGVVVSIILTILLPIVAGMVWYKTATIAAFIAWWQYEPSKSKAWPLLAGGIGLALLFALFFAWLPVWWPEAGEARKEITAFLLRNTVVWGVIAALALAFAKAMLSTGAPAPGTPTTGPRSESRLRRVVGAIVSWVVIIIAILLLAAASIWAAKHISRFAAAHRHQAWVTSTRTLIAYEVFSLGSREHLKVILPARMTTGACVKCPTESQHCWTTNVSGPIFTRPDCQGAWRDEGPAQENRYAYRLGGIGVWNPGPREESIIFHAQ